MIQAELPSSAPNADVPLLKSTVPMHISKTRKATKGTGSLEFSLAGITLSTEKCQRACGGKELPKKAQGLCDGQAHVLVEHISLARTQRGALPAICMHCTSWCAKDRKGVEEKKENSPTHWLLQ